MSPRSSSITDTEEQLSQDHITGQTPMGGNLMTTGSGATFKVWAPAARKVAVLWEYKKDENGSWTHGKAGRLVRMSDGLWAGFVPGLVSGDQYMFHVVGPEGGTEEGSRDSLR